MPRDFRARASKMRQRGRFVVAITRASGMAIRAGLTQQDGHQGDHAHSAGSDAYQVATWQGMHHIQSSGSGRLAAFTMRSDHRERRRRGQQAAHRSGGVACT